MPNSWRVAAPHTPLGAGVARLGTRDSADPAAIHQPYVKGSKNDAIDAAAICEAMSRPGVRFVPVKSVEDQAALMLLKVRDLLVKQRTMLMPWDCISATVRGNVARAIRGHRGQ